MRYSVLMAAAVFTVGLSAWAADRGDREAKGSVLPGKKGVCLTLRDPDSAQGRKKGGTWEQNMPRVRKLNASWNYSWGLSYPENQPSDLMFLPMVWGGSSDLPAVLERELRPYVKAGRKPPMVMGFNEPDKRNQSNMTVEAALELWPTLEALGVPLVSPACAN
ncbi:MAG: glycosyl hydrolase, partial [Phycisphaeraceae bacterium]|nr:glycosyl hydrolase [Phycisphaeraceae bacterium]